MTVYHAYSSGYQRFKSLGGALGRIIDLARCGTYYLCRRLGLEVRYPKTLVDEFSSIQLIPRPFVTVPPFFDSAPNRSLYHEF